MFIIWAFLDTTIYLIKTHKFKIFAKTEEEIILKKQAIRLQFNKIILNFIYVIILGVLFNLSQKKLGIDLTFILPQDLLDKIPIDLKTNQNVIYFIIALIITTLITLNTVKKENEEAIKKVE